MKQCDQESDDRFEVTLGSTIVRSIGDPDVAFALFALARSKDLLRMELNRLMFSVSYRRYLTVVRGLDDLCPGIDRFIRQ